MFSQHACSFSPLHIKFRWQQALNSPSVSPQTIRVWSQVRQESHSPRGDFSHPLTLPLLSVPFICCSHTALSSLPSWAVSRPFTRRAVSECLAELGTEPSRGARGAGSPPALARGLPGTWHFPDSLPGSPLGQTGPHSSVLFLSSPERREPKRCLFSYSKDKVPGKQEGLWAVRGGIWQ